MESTPLRGTIVEPSFVFCQVLKCGLNLLLGFGRGSGHSLGSCQDMGFLVVEKARQAGFHPFSVLAGFFAVLNVSQIVEVFGTMIVIEDLLGRRKDLLDTIPNPGSSIRDYAKP